MRFANMLTQHYKRLTIWQPFNNAINQFIFIQCVTYLYKTNIFTNSIHHDRKIRFIHPMTKARKHSVGKKSKKQNTLNNIKKPNSMLPLTQNVPLKCLLQNIQYKM